MKIEIDETTAAALSMIIWHAVSEAKKGAGLATGERQRQGD